jgi:UDP-glucose 4-epimerase
MMKIVITGGAGFIGSNLCKKIIKQKNSTITVIDNLSNGKKDFLKDGIAKKKIHLIRSNLLNATKISDQIKKHSIIYHLSANSDISLSAQCTKIDINQTLLCTHKILDAARLNKVKKFVYTSGSGVYGNLDEFGPNESFGPLLPVSLYGATKLGAEALISAYSFLFDIQSFIFRFANVVGPNQTHGVAYDFIRKLKKNPKYLVVLGNGLQSKSYVHVSDVIKAMFLAQKRAVEKVNVFNVGSGDYITVREIAHIVIKEMKLKNTKIIYGKNTIGWKGDVAKVRINDTKIRSLGWSNSFSSAEAVTNAVKSMLAGEIK